MSVNTNLRSQHVGCDAGRELDDKDEREEHGERDGHAVALLRKVQQAQYGKRDFTELREGRRLRSADYEEFWCGSGI